LISIIGTLHDVTTRPTHQSFIPLPSVEAIQIAWPTQNHFLLDAPEKFFARTRVNADYGRPGFTRDCGKRFHWGCDIAPVNVTATGKTTRVIFTDCATGADFESEEPTFVPEDEVFCVLDGRVAEVVEDENVSDFGKHVVIEHVWPRSGEKFFTVYGHLGEIDGRAATTERGPPQGVAKGQLIGKMGQTSRSADARNWMSIAPHLHFEVRDVSLNGRAYEPVEFLSRFLPPSL
jgi:murein DD-endopeptidase MepM/ murein hydrolase activator NlpD